jgi:hypothetical protein
MRWLNRGFNMKFNRRRFILSAAGVLVPYVAKPQFAGFSFPYISKVGGGGSSLFTGLISMWKLDDAANGTRVDSFGSNNLTDNLGNVGINNSSGVPNPNTPKLTQCAGGFGQVSNNTCLTHADNASLGIGSGKSFTIATWIYSQSNANCNIMGKWSNNSTLQDYALYTQPLGDGNSYYSVVMFNLAGSSTSFTANNGDNKYHMFTNAWTFIVWGYDDSVQKMFLKAGSGASMDTTGYTSSLVGVRRTSCNFILGSLLNGGLAMWGSLDDTAMWSRTLTNTELNNLYNGGAGLPFSSWT